MRPTAVFFWDYDTQWGGDRSRLPGGIKHWGMQEFENTDRLLALHAHHGVKACFAVVGSAALPGDRPYHDPAQIREIHKAGHEIGSHTHVHEWLPGLGWPALLGTLKDSKDALEQCIGASVTTFVPPWNQPFDHVPGGSISIAERMSVHEDRIDLRRLCTALQETGYSFCRVAYRSIARNLIERMTGKRIDRPERVRTIGGITCVRLNTPDGFDEPAIRMVRRCADKGGVVVLHGHPHSITSGNAQDLRYLEPLMQEVASLQSSGRMRVVLPRDLVKEQGAA